MIDVAPSSSTDRPQCDCTTIRIVQRLRADGVLIYVRQCQQCGRNCGAVSKKSPEVLQLAEIPQWDETLHERWRASISAYWQQQREEAEHDRERQNQEWWRRYNAYLLTGAWKAKRAQVMERASGLCEGCRKRPATQVHHLTYDHMGDELLFELVAICGVCHRKLHPHMDDL